MSTRELIQLELEGLPESLQREVYDFARFLKLKSNGEAQKNSQATDAAPLAKLAAIASAHPENPDQPTDLAAQHDHYLYGTPKR